nr:unnamed protein product [Callosobruchus chinensis]
MPLSSELLPLAYSEDEDMPMLSINPKSSNRKQLHTLPASKSAASASENDDVIIRSTFSESKKWGSTDILNGEYGKFFCNKPDIRIDTTPAACGEAIEVPFINCEYRNVKLGTEVMAPPGAHT